MNKEGEEDEEVEADEEEDVVCIMQTVSNH